MKILIVYFGHVFKDGHAPFSSQDFVNLQIAFVPWFANIKLNKKKLKKVGQLCRKAYIHVFSACILRVKL